VVIAAERMLIPMSRESHDGSRESRVGVTRSLSLIIGNCPFSAMTLSIRPISVTITVYTSPNRPKYTTILFKALSSLGMNSLWNT